MATVMVSYLLFKVVLVCGLALLCLVFSINNIKGFGGAAAEVARTFSMNALQQPPRIDIAMSGRAVHSAIWPRLSLFIVLALQIVATFAFFMSLALFISSAIHGGVDHAGVSAANFGLSMLSISWFLMIIGGTWFAYWIRQELLHLTHLIYLGLTIAAAIALNQ